VASPTPSPSDNHAFIQNTILSVLEIIKKYAKPPHTKLWVCKGYYSIFNKFSFRPILQRNLFVLHRSFVSIAEVAESLFQTPTPLLFQNFCIQIWVRIFFNFDDPTLVPTPVSIDPIEIHQCFMRGNDHTDPRYCRNWKVTPAPGPTERKRQNPTGFDSGSPDPDPWPPLVYRALVCRNAKGGLDACSNVRELFAYLHSNWQAKRCGANAPKHIYSTLLKPKACHYHGRRCCWQMFSLEPVV